MCKFFVNYLLKCSLTRTFFSVFFILKKREKKMSKIMLWITEKSPDESYRLIPKFIVKNNLHFNFLFVTFTPYYYPTFTAIMIQKTHSSALPFIYVFVMLLYTQIHTQLLLHARVQNSRNVFPSDGFKVGGMGWVFWSECWRLPIV